MPDVFKTIVQEHVDASATEDVLAREEWPSRRRMPSEHVLVIPAREKKSRGGRATSRPLPFMIVTADPNDRRLSPQPRGLQTFPHASSTSPWHAIAIALKNVFVTHPIWQLSDSVLVGIIIDVAAYALAFPFKKAAEFFVRASEAAAHGAMACVSAVAGAFVKREAAEAPVVSEPELVVEHPAETVELAPAKTFSFGLAEHWHRSALTFAAIAAIIMVPASGFAVFGEPKQTPVFARLETVKTSLEQAKSAIESHDFARTQAALIDTAKNISLIRSALGPAAPLLSIASTVMPPQWSISAAEPLLSFGEYAAIGGATLSEGVIASQSTSDTIQKLAILKSSVDSALPHITKANDIIARVSPLALPANYRSEVTMAKEKFPILVADLRKAQEALDVIPQILGADAPRRYLVVLQNNAELRPTGGFIGSFALLDVDRGKITKVEIPGGGSYDLQGSLSLKLLAPQPLQLISPRWEFQDANWSPDFPTSAQTLARFYEKSGGPTTDGVIAMNMTLMQRLLEITGPIPMPEYGKTIDSANFYQTVQQQVEVDYDKTLNKPKKILSDLAPKVLNKLTHADGATLVKAAQVIGQALEERDLILWNSHADIQSQLVDLGWDGALKTTQGDYLSMVHTNIAGQKTDLVMHDDLHRDIKVFDDGSAVVKLTLNRTHSGIKGQQFSGVRNVDYVRFYVPQGSTLIEATGFTRPDPKLFGIPSAEFAPDPAISAEESSSILDVSSGTQTYVDQGKTVFANWIMTDPGMTSHVTLSYAIPSGVLRSQPARLFAAKRTVKTYSFYLQKQPGENPFAFSSSVSWPSGYVPDQTATGDPQLVSRDTSSETTLVH